MINFLCVCQYGHSRSAAMVRVLHGRGHAAVALGVGTATPKIMNILSDWADVVCVMQPAFSESILPAYRHKVVVVDVGPDRWSNPYSQELLGILQREADQRGW